MKRILNIAFLLVAISVFKDTYAASTSGNVSVNVISQFTFTELAIVDFNLIPNTDGICSMSSSGNLSGQCAGSPNGQTGEILVQGTPKQWITVTVSQLSPVDGVTFDPKIMSNGVYTKSMKLNNSGEANVGIMGDLILSGATGGAKSLTYLINVVYE